jgi:hypothetical protein
VAGALKRSVLHLLDGDSSRRIAVTLKDGAGRFTGEMVSIEHSILTLALGDGVDFSALLACPVEQVLSVELLETVDL